MANYGYYRVSTSESNTKRIKSAEKREKQEKQAKQTFERQQSILASSGIVFDQIFQEHISGGIRADQRAEFNKLLAVLKEGDTIVVSETSRFGRNYIDNMDMVDIITVEYNANIKFLSNGIELKGGENLDTEQWFVLSMLFLVDERQKRQIGDNTRKALQAKIAKGQKLGTPIRALSKEQIALLKTDRLNGMSWDDLQEKWGVSRGTIAKNLRQEE